MSFDYIKKIDLISLIEADLGKGVTTGKWVKFDCPFCKHIRRDSKKYLVVTNGDEKRGGVYICKYCSRGGDAHTWLKEYRHMTSIQALDYLRSFRTIEAENPTA